MTFGQERSSRQRAFARRLLRRREQELNLSATASGNMSLIGKANARRSRLWLGMPRTRSRSASSASRWKSCASRSGKCRPRSNTKSANCGAKCEAESRITGQLQHLASRLSHERTRGSRVDARGLGPIAWGIILTCLADELAGGAVVGWLAVVIAVAWVVRVVRGWLRDFNEGLSYSGLGLQTGDDPRSSERSAARGKTVGCDGRPGAPPYDRVSFAAAPDRPLFPAWPMAASLIATE